MIKLKEDSNMKTVKLQVNSRDFLNWFYSDIFDFGTGFDYENFKFSCDSSFSFSYVDIGYTCRDIPEPMRLYTVYGRLRSMHESQTKIAIKVHYSENEAKNLMYEYIVSFRGMMLRFTTCREYPAFTWAKITGTKPVLCLESKTALTQQAMCEIADAIREGYYNNGDDPKNFFYDFDNVLEVRDWMQYKTRCSPEYFMDECECGAGDLCDAAIIKALNWFRTGYETGALQLTDDLSCPVLNKLGFEYKTY